MSVKRFKDFLNENEYDRTNISNELEIDKSELEDSADLGDMADELSDNINDVNYVQDEVDELFDMYLNDNDTSSLFVDVLSPTFKYDRAKTLYTAIIKYYPEFSEEFGDLEEFDTPIFKDLLKNKVVSYIKSKTELFNESLTKGKDYSDMDESDREYIIQKQEREKKKIEEAKKYLTIIKFLAKNPTDVPQKTQLEIVKLLKSNIENMPIRLQEILKK